MSAEFRAACIAVGKLAASHEELREAALAFVPQHSGSCIPVINGVLAVGVPVTRETCKCDEKTKRLRTALEAW